MATYLIGLLYRNTRTSCVSLALLCARISHDTLRRVLYQKVPWSRRRWESFAQGLVQRGGYLVIDDSSWERFTRISEAVSWVWSSSVGKPVWGMQVVLLLWTDGKWKVPRQRGKNPAGDPTGASPAVPPGVRSDRLRPAPLAEMAHTRQSACATSASNSVRCPLDLQSPDWTSPHAPIGEWSRAAPSVAGSCLHAVARLMPAVRQRLTESHSGGRAYSPHRAQRC